MIRFISIVTVGFLLFGVGILAVQTWEDFQEQQNPPTVVEGDYADQWRIARDDISSAKSAVVSGQETQTELADTGYDTAVLDAAIAEALTLLPSTTDLGRQSAKGEDQDPDNLAAIIADSARIKELIDAAYVELASWAPARAAVLNTPEVIAAADEFVADPSAYGAAAYAAAEMQARLDVRWNDGQPISLVGNGAGVAEKPGPELREPAPVAGEPAPIDMTRYADTSDRKYVPWESCGNPQGWMKVDPGAGLTAFEMYPFPWSYQVENGGQGFVAYYVCS